MAEQHTEIQVALGKIETTMDSHGKILSRIESHLKEQNGRISKTETKVAVQCEKIETNEKNICTNNKTIKANTWKIGLLVGGIVGLREVGSWLLG